MAETKNRHLYRPKNLISRRTEADDNDATEVHSDVSMHSGTTSSNR